MDVVYGTQGGGLAKRVDGLWIFFKAPSWGNFKKGDLVPLEWSLAGPFLYDEGNPNSNLEQIEGPLDQEN